MRAAMMLVGVWALLGAATTTPAGEFVTGHVFVTVWQADPCDFGGEEAILEIDPVTGGNEHLRRFQRRNLRGRRSGVYAGRYAPATA